MKIITPGHVFLLDGYDGGRPQRLTFMQRTGPKYPGNERAHGGTNMQEVLRALISRAAYVNDQTPCPETELALHSMMNSLCLMEMRAQRRRGLALSCRTVGEIYMSETCPTCGNICCTLHGEQK